MPKSFLFVSLTSYFSFFLRHCMWSDSISENTTMKILFIGLLPDLSFLSKASIMCFLTQWTPCTTVSFAESLSSQCRCPVRFLPLHLTGSMPADGQMPQAQLAVCLVESSNTLAYFFLAFKPVCCKDDPWFNRTQQYQLEGRLLLRD